MLRNLGIRSKILATLSIPVLLLLVVAGALIKDSIDKRLVAKSYASVIETNASFNQLIHAVQAERSLSMAVLSGDITKQPILNQTRSGISDGLSQIETKYGDTNPDNSRVNSPGISRIWNQMRSFNSNLDSIRRRIDKKQMTVAQVNSAYSAAVTDLLKIPSSLAQEYPVLSMQRFLNVVSVAEGANEAVMRERDALAPILTVGGYSSAGEQQAARLAIMRRVVTGESARSLSSAVNGKLPTNSPLTDLENKMLTLNVGQDPKVSLDSLNSASSTESNSLSAFEAQQKAVARTDVQSAIDAATQRLIWTVLGSLLVLASMVLLALYMSRTISAPLRRLTHAVSRVHTKLPEIVNRDNPDQRVTLTEDMVVPIEGDDEIGRLASSFNEVNQAVVDTANSQAELRSSIAGMFVNVARRDQTLLSRQLSLIDQLERTEEDPQTLSTLFKLDHLSTRMRRNAEALLVLAGIDTGRRLRRAMALSDVVRTASSEIEHYDRVDLVQTVDPQMLGHTALSAASMLAELLENATAFSDPNSRVSVRTENSPGGIAVIITDEGLGMTQAEVDEANKKISSVSLAEVVASKRIGFFVVGRLARRLEASVVVNRGAGKGTMVRVEFPPQVFVPGAVTHVTGGDTQRSDEQPAIPTSRTPQGAASPTAAVPAAPAATSSTPAALTKEPKPGPAATPAAGTAAAAGAAAAGLARRDTPARTKPDAEERLSKAAQARPQTPASATPDLSKNEALANEVAEPLNPPKAPASSTAPMPKRERPAPAAAPEDKATPTLPQRSERSAPVPQTESAAPSTREVPEQRPESQGARGGLFSSFRRTRDLPEAPGAGAAPQPAATVPDTTPTATVSPSPAPTTPAKEAPAKAEPAKDGADKGSEAPKDAPAAKAAEAPVPTGSGARDILPGAGRKPASGRGGSLFSRLGEASAAAPAAATSRPTPAPPKPADPAPAPAAKQAAEPTTGTSTPAAPTKDAPLPARRTSQEAPVQRLADTAQPAGPGFAAEALSELSRLQAYRPRTMPVSKDAPEAEKPATLVRRQAGATPAGQLPPPRPQPSSSRRGRSAADVRSMLSGFQAGVERGRSTTPEPTSEAAGDSPAT